MTDLRRVRRVSLRAPSEELARRGALLLEDALRTASWADAVPGRVIVVRRLDAGVIDPDEGPSSLSIRLEARLREIGARLVHARAPDASGADAVFFRDAVEAAATLAEHASRTPEPAPWFVGRAVPSYHPEAGPRHALRAALAAALEASPHGAVALVEALLSRGAAGPLLRALEPRDGPVLLAALGVAEVPPGAPERAPGRAPNARPWASGEPAEGSAGRRTGPGATAAAVKDPPAAPGSGTRGTEGPSPVPEGGTSVPEVGSGVPAGATLVPAPSRPAKERLARREDRRAGARAAPGRVTAEEAPPVAEPFRAALREHIPAWGAADARSAWLAAAAMLARAPGARHDPRFAAKAAELARSFASGDVTGAPVAAPTVPFEPTAPADGAWSPRGGLLFLVPLLARFDLARFLEVHPAFAEAGLPHHLLRDVARRLGAPPDDPILAALGPPPPPLPDVAFTEPASLTAVAGPPPRASLASPPPRSSHGGLRALHVFRTALRRAARRTIGLGLRSLVERPGRVFFTRTHVDVVLDLRRVHLGIRRAGADLDPGWVPWLGRVVRFHYRRGEERDG